MTLKGEQEGKNTTGEGNLYKVRVKGKSEGVYSWRDGLVPNEKILMLC